MPEPYGVTSQKIAFFMYEKVVIIVGLSFIDSNHPRV
jgi:hypothetical protein